MVEVVLGIGEGVSFGGVEVSLGGEEVLGGDEVVLMKLGFALGFSVHDDEKDDEVWFWKCS